MSAASMAAARGPCLRRRGGAGGARRRRRLRARAEAAAAAAAASAAAARAQLAPVRLSGVGSAVPARSVSNDELGAFLDTGDAWIRPRTGIASRHILTADESMTDLCADALGSALDMAGLQADQLDMIILCTSTPEDLFGGAGAVQAAVGATQAVAYDLTAACSGFVLGLVTACNHVRVGGPVQRVAVIGADCLSRTVDWGDRRTSILFGDGCGALIVERAEEGAECALLGYDMRSDGQGGPSLNCKYEGARHELPLGVGGGAEAGAEAGAGADGGADADADNEHRAEVEAGGGGAQAAAGSPLTVRNRGEFEYLAMNGTEVFKFAVRAVPQVVTGALEMAGKQVEDIDWLVLHQANARILSAAADRLGVERERVASNVERYGNTSAASVPLVLDEYVRAGKIKNGDVLATAGFGAGLTWASALVRWG